MYPCWVVTLNVLAMNLLYRMNHIDLDEAVSHWHVEMNSVGGGVRGHMNSCELL